VYLVDLSQGLPQIDSFVMSCRAIGRGIETAVMNTIKEEFLSTRGYAALLADFVPTKKNVPAQAFYESQGFARVAEAEPGRQSFRLDADQASPIDCPHVAIV
jgi:predicted enzyme involved in methoxymalonyl-ACP biosynthesis